MDQLAGIARALAVLAIEEAIAAGGDPGEISDAQDALAEGDTLRDAGQFKDAVKKYKDAFAKAESANPTLRMAGTDGAENEPELAVQVQETPRQFVLYQNYPNPFNPRTEIRFALPEAGHVQLVVYDVMGREVARLIDQPLGAGTHAVTWDASRLPSG